MDKTKLNVLYFVPHVQRSHGGIYQYALGLLKCLKNSRHNYYVLCYTATDELIELAANSENIHVVSYSRLKTKLLLFLYYSQGFINRAFNFLLHKRVIFGNKFLFNGLLKKLDIDLIHCPTQRILKHQRIPSITTLHDIQQFHYPEFFSKWEINYRQINYPKILSQAKKIIVSYQHIKTDLINHFKLTNDQVEICLIDMQNLWFDKYKNKTVDRIAADFILYPAATWPHKNHLKLLEALVWLKNRKGISIHLICTGNLTEHFHILEKYIHEHQLEKQVSFEGIVSEERLYQLYQNTRAVVVPTLYEAGSFPLMEAIILGVSVICSNVTSLPETIGNNKFVFDPENISDLANKIELIYSDENYRNENKHLLQSQAEKIMNTNAHLKIENIYESCLDQ